MTRLHILKKRYFFLSYKTLSYKHPIYLPTSVAIKIEFVFVMTKRISIFILQIGYFRLNY